jgi:hypothetical protein
MSGGGRRVEALARALRTVAEDDEMLGASPEVASRLLAEAHVIARARRIRVYAVAGAFTAALLVAIAAPVWRSVSLRPAVDPASQPEPAARSSSGEVTTEFFPLMYSNVPVTNGHTVRLELPQAALTSFGLEADDASGTVLADVLVGQDGLARAVRFVRPVISKKEQR